MEQPKDASIQKMWNYAEKFAEKSGTHLHPQREVTEAVVLGLASHIDRYGRPICPRNFYPEKAADGSFPDGLYLPRDEEAKRRTWICACDEKYVLSFTTPGILGVMRLSRGATDCGGAGGNSGRVAILP